MLVIEPQLGVPLPPDISYMDLRARIDAACKSARELEAHGLDLTPDEDDKAVAAKLAIAYATDPEKTSKKVTTQRAATIRPASIVLTDSILKEFAHSVVESAQQVRHLVTNKLLLETDNPDPRIRVRALELLGKISDVGLFTDKSEVTITHQTTDDLRAKLRAKLTKLVNPEDGDGIVTLAGEVIDVDEELGDSPDDTDG